MTLAIALAPKGPTRASLSKAESGICASMNSSSEGSYCQSIRRCSFGAVDVEVEAIIFVMSDRERVAGDLMGQKMPVVVRMSEIIVADVC